MDEELDNKAGMGDSSPDVTEKPSQTDGDEGCKPQPVEKIMVKVDQEHLEKLNDLLNEQIDHIAKLEEENELLAKQLKSEKAKSASLKSRLRKDVPGSEKVVDHH